MEGRGVTGRGIGALAVAFAMCVPAGRRAAAEDEGGPSSETVRAATGKGVAFLRSHQDVDGSWGPIVGSAAYGGGNPGAAYLHPAGPTALSLYALLASGVPKNDPAIKKGFAWVEKSKSDAGPSAYELSARILAVTARSGCPLAWRRGDIVRLDGDDKRKAQALVDALLAMRTNAKTSGWRYDIRSAVPPGGNEDLSSTGLAALALFTADRCGVKVPLDLWPELAAYARAQQEEGGTECARAVDEASPDLSAKASAPPAAAQKPAGDAAPARDHARGFSYIRSERLDPDEGRPSGGITACGIATVQIARLVLGKRGLKGWGAKDQGDARQSVLDGCAWLDANWSATANPGKQRFDIYHLLYLEHVADAMDLVGTPRIGGRSWYAEAARGLLQSQKENGSWDTNSTHKPTDVLDTCFALLFFARPFAAPAPAAAAGK